MNSAQARLARKRRANTRARRRETRRNSQLRTWNIQELPNGGLGITCPYPKCSGKAKVNKKKWIESKPAESRSCTYCYKVSWIPEELL